MAHTPFLFPFTSEITDDLKIPKYHCYVIYATVTAMQKIPGLPGSEQPRKVKICDMKPPCMYAIVFLCILLTVHLQSTVVFYTVGTVLHEVLHSWHMDLQP